MNTELFILWTNDNLITTEKMLFMYAHNAIKRGWWEKITIIIWGATSALTASNKNVQAKIKEMISDGVEFIACEACAEQLEVVQELRGLGIEVFHTGEKLTEIIKSGKKLITV